MPIVEPTWSIDGTPLLSLASWVQRLDTAVMPPLRGSGRQHAFKAGAAHRSRVADSRTITLGLRLAGRDLDGDTPAEWADAYTEAERTLLRLLRPAGGGQFALAYSWTDDLGAHTATAMGICPEGADRVRRGPWSSRCTVDILLEDPWFYGTAVETTITVGVPVVVGNAGDEPTTAVEVEFNGGLANPKVTNATPAPDVWVKVGSSVAAGDTVTVDVDATTVLRDSDGANLIGALTHSGARSWFGLARGNNTVTLTADSGTGSAVLRHRPIYY